MNKKSPIGLALAALVSVVAAVSIVACGGGGAAANVNAAAAPSGAAAQAVSSGVVTAFGSVFVNGHEFNTTNATVVDDDTGAVGGVGALEVGMPVRVVAASDSSEGHPVAGELHFRPLARGFVDAYDATGSTLTVMGQSVALTAATNFSDHRACLTAASPCAPITGASGLSVTTGPGAGGSYVAVHGFLYNDPAAPGANIIATLISVADAPVGGTGASYKAEGLVSAVSGSQVKIGGLSVDLSAATCYVANKTATACASAYSVGQTVSTFSAVAPVLPAVQFSASTALLRDSLSAQAPGSTMEFEGRVSSVTASPASFTADGIVVDASALPSGQLPAVGDQVRVLGTVSAGGTSVLASSVIVEEVAKSATYGFEGDYSSLAAGAAANTYVVTLLGQTMTVDATTELADRSLHGLGQDPSNAPPLFNINNFLTYLQAPNVSQHLQVRAVVDGNGNLHAMSLTILPASTLASVAGVIDASPVPVNGTAGSSSTTFDVHGLAVSADPTAVVARPGHNPPTTVAAGDLVLVRGSWTAGVLTVAAPVGPITRESPNAVLDSGPPKSGDQDGF